MVLLNLGMLTLSTLLCIALRKLIQRMHGRMFDLGPDAINAFLYGYLGVYKMVFIVFSLVPWLALVIMS